MGEGFIDHFAGVSKMITAIALNLAKKARSISFVSLLMPKLCCL